MSATHLEQSPLPEATKIVVGISSCLIGESVRYDGGHKYNPSIVQTLGQFFDLQSFCPEVAIGLGVPREPIRLIQQNNQLRCVAVKSPELDFTERLIASADAKTEWHQQLCGYILKKGSPSCGMERVKVFENDQPSPTGVGMYANRLMENFPLLPVEEEERLGDAALREGFIERVYRFYRWKKLLAAGVTVHKLTQS